MPHPVHPSKDEAMSAKNHDAKHGDVYARVTPRPFHGPQRDATPRSTAPPGWISESIGLDSRAFSLPSSTGASTASLPYERVSPDVARPAAPLMASAAMAHERSRPRWAAEPLDPDTTRWLDQLPPGIRPRELPRLFPRIANKLCSLRTNPAVSNRYLSNLLMDTRDGAREGFPLAVAGELAALLIREEPQRESRWSRVENR